MKKRPIEDDDDDAPMTKAELGKLKKVSPFKQVRWKLGLSQVEFAERFGIPLGTLRDWEQRNPKLDGVRRTLLQAIEMYPEQMAKAAKKAAA
ncbi:MAG: transcriptional regulator [Hyphomicrobium sp.]|uniref:helix-turn-helix domain-containing protein n=1 Tax=Hyphomicrobium sp. TaxID=82 RepID=UPI0039E32792